MILIISDIVTYNLVYIPFNNGLHTSIVIIWILMIIISYNDYSLNYNYIPYNDYLLWFPITIMILIISDIVIYNLVYIPFNNGLYTSIIIIWSGNYNHYR